MAKAPDSDARKSARSTAKAKPAAGAKTLAKGKSGKRPASARRAARKTFLVAAEQPAEEGQSGLCVYAAVTRTPAEALAAVRDLIGPEIAVGLTGKLSGRMAKALGLKPGEVRRI